MHLQQTKAGSLATGGPQYFFHNLTAPVKEYLRKRGAWPVILQTPYGIAESPFMAVGRDHKLSAKGKPVPGKVGHDRIQQAAGSQSIGEAIRHWYGLKHGHDFERIDVQVEFHGDDHFILIPTAVKMRGADRVLTLERVREPLSFHRDYQSKFWRGQIEAGRGRDRQALAWAAAQISRVVADHTAGAANILEADLLRATGALSILGLQLGAYLGKGYDCRESRFQFSPLPEYPCPVEIKKRSRDFRYQMRKYDPLPRAVVLCMDHDIVNPPAHIDFIELRELGKFLRA